MRFLVDILQLFYGVVGVYLGGCQAAVAQKLFNRVQVRPIVGQVGGKSVAQHVGTALFYGGYQA